MALLALHSCCMLLFLAAVCTPTVVAQALDDIGPIHNDFLIYTLVPWTLLAFTSFYALLRVWYWKWTLPNHIGIPLLWAMYGPLMFLSMFSDDDWNSKLIGMSVVAGAALYSVIAWDTLHNPLAYRRIPDGDGNNPNWNNHGANHP